jgi:hypothetical protein
VIFAWQQLRIFAACANFSICQSQEGGFETRPYIAFFATFCVLCGELSEAESSII